MIDNLNIPSDIRLTGYSSKIQCSLHLILPKNFGAMRSYRWRIELGVKQVPGLVVSQCFQTVPYFLRQWKSRNVSQVHILHNYIYISIHMYMCGYVCMYVCIHVCMYACMHVCMHACMHVCMHACMYVCMYVCMYYVYSCYRNQCQLWCLLTPCSFHSYLILLKGCFQGCSPVARTSVSRNWPLFQPWNVFELYLLVGGDFHRHCLGDTDSPFFGGS